MNYKASRLVNKAYTQLEKQNYSQALELLKQAKDADPKSDEVYAYLGEGYIYNERYEEAMIVFDERETLEVKSSHLNPYIEGYRGRIFFERGDIDKAEELVDKAALENANEPEILLTKALIQEYKGQKKSALGSMRKIDTHDPSFYYRKIKVLLKKFSHLNSADVKEKIKDNEC